MSVGVLVTLLGFNAMALYPKGYRVYPSGVSRDRGRGARFISLYGDNKPLLARLTVLLPIALSLGESQQTHTCVLGGIVQHVAQERL